MRLLLALIFLASCTFIDDKRGNIIKPEKQENIIEGFTTAQQVFKELGSPSTTSDFNSKVWYYIYSETNAAFFYEPVNDTQQVLAIEFDNAGVVKSVQQFSEDDAQSVSFASDTTEVKGHNTYGFFEQIFNNLGKFSKQEAE